MVYNIVMVGRLIHTVYLLDTVDSVERVVSVDTVYRGLWSFQFTKLTWLTW